MRFVAHSLIVCLSRAAVATAGADEWTVRNPTKDDYRRTPVRLNLSPPSEPFSDWGRDRHEPPAWRRQAAAPEETP